MNVHLGIGAAGLLGTYAAAALLPHETALNVLGYTGVGFVVVMFGGPLATMRTVIEQRSTASLPFAFTIAAFVNCLTWTGTASSLC